jgi:dCTP deaminase
MILSDRELRTEIEDGYLRFDPAIDLDSQVQDGSIDLRLGDTLRVPEKVEGAVFYPSERITPDKQGREEKIPANGYILGPHEFVLGRTLERVSLPLHLAARLEGKSSLARIGLIIHFTSGQIAPGFQGIIVLEMVNHGPNRIALVPGMPIGQLVFEKMSMLPKKAYSGRYSGQMNP